MPCTSISSARFCESSVAALFMLSCLSTGLMAEQLPATDDDAINEDSERAGIYRTPREQREAGLQREFSEWLRFSGLLEGEALSYRQQYNTPALDKTVREQAATLQLGFIADLYEWAEAEVVFEYDSDPDEIVVEEAFITLDFEPFELSLGKQYTPFGLYYSNFITGPMLEFGETSARHVALANYGSDDSFDLSIAAYKGWANQQGRHDSWDWAIGFEHAPLEGLLWGLSYQTDLADSDERLLEDDRYVNRVPGFSGFISAYSDAFGCSFEILGALRDFQELDPEFNHPRAWNLEFAYFLPGTDFEYAIRLEKSQELEDEPEVRYGMATTWYVNHQIIFMLEFLHGRYKTMPQDPEDEDFEAAIERVNALNAKLSIQF
ncbi:MAG: LbtU family siderophore porin [Candidatus Thiodiazotropha sp.]